MEGIRFLKYDAFLTDTKIRHEAERNLFHLIILTRIKPPLYLNELSCSFQITYPLDKIT